MNTALSGHYIVYNFSQLLGCQSAHLLGYFRLKGVGNNYREVPLYN